MSVLDKFRKPSSAKINKCAAVIVAAGASQRMGCDKILAEFGGMPVIARTVSVFEKCQNINEIIIVTRSESIVPVADICKKYGFQKVSKVICGGSTRAESALAGVCEVRPKTKLIAIHDGARPLVTEPLIVSVIDAAAEHIAAAPAVPATDTIKLVDEEGAVTETVDRDRAVLMQTPQVFNASIIKGALTRAAEKGLKITDDCAAVEAIGVKVYTVPGEEWNIKLTRPMDLVIAEKILADRGEDA
jgi:2-C-methyl-D-erythritol 4-phosphate cytidylyltransferase